MTLLLSELCICYLGRFNFLNYLLSKLLCVYKIIHILILYIQVVPIYVDLRYNEKAKLNSYCFYCRILVYKNLAFVIHKIFGLSSMVNLWITEVLELKKVLHYHSVYCEDEALLCYHKNQISWITDILGLSCSSSLGFYNCTSRPAHIVVQSLLHLGQ